MTKKNTKQRKTAGSEPPQPMKENSKPEKRFVSGQITATVWSNLAQGENGQVRYRTIQFQRRYTDEKGVWKNSNTLRASEVPRAITVLQKAYEYLVLQEGERP